MGLLMIALMFVISINYMNRKQKTYIRRVAGLDAIDEAIGRSTEMGKPHFAMIGVGMFDHWTMAALQILAYQARICAEMNTRLIVPTGGSDGAMLTREVALDIVNNEYAVAGRAGEFDENDMPYLSGVPWALGAGTVAMIQDLSPGSFVLTGSFGSVALHITEQASQAGALTITSGSYMGNVAALSCASNYTLIGEEVPAASAYLSQDPVKLASIRTQDIFKFVAIAATILGSLLVQFGSNFLVELFMT